MDCSEFSSCLSAFLVPTITIVGMFLGIYNFRLSVKKRNVELFDRRYEFYKKLEKYWLSTGHSAESVSKDPHCDIEDLISFAKESRFLFGNDISEHIISLEGKGHYGSLMFPNSDFSEPFGKYLNFE